MKKEVVDKLNRIQELLQQRDNIDNILEGLLGVGENAPRIIAKPPKNAKKKSSKVRTCAKCGQPGHRSDSPQFHPKDAPDTTDTGTSNTRDE